MVKVITYGTYDLLHYGHIRLLERAKALGDYLIVGVTADDFDKQRGKINVQQSLMERIEAVRAIGIADEIIIEEYEGQKIDDIKRYDVDIFTVGSDWEGKFDYLNEFCKVVYMERTQGVSSTDIRGKERLLLLGIVGDTSFLNKIEAECRYINGLCIEGVCTNNLEIMSDEIKKLPLVTNSYSELLNNVDAVYIRSFPNVHYKQIKEALEKGKHVLCESPIVLKEDEYNELYEVAKKNNLILMEAIKTAYATAYERLLLLLKGGIIGDIVSVESTCTSLKNNKKENVARYDWNCMFEWAPTALLPIFQILGVDYVSDSIVVRYLDERKTQEGFVKINFLYSNAVASLKISNSIKSEGELVISGTRGYIYVPAPWWKTDYFEIRYEDMTENKRYFYQLDGEGIRNELAAFVRSAYSQKESLNVPKEISLAISKVMDNFIDKKNVYEII